MDSRVVGVGVHKAGDFATGLLFRTNFFVVAAQLSGVGRNDRLVNAAGTGRLSHSDLPDDGLGGKIPLVVGVAAAGSDGLGDLRLLLAACCSRRCS